MENPEPDMWLNTCLLQHSVLSKVFLPYCEIILNMCWRDTYNGEFYNECRWGRKKNREEKKFLVTFPGGLEAQQIKSPDK